MNSLLLCIALKLKANKGKIKPVNKHISTNRWLRESVSYFIKPNGNVKNAIVTYVAICTYLGFALISLVYVNRKSFVIFIDLFRGQFMTYISILSRICQISFFTAQ